LDNKVENDKLVAHRKEDFDTWGIVVAQTKKRKVMAPPPIDEGEKESIRSAEALGIEWFVCLCAILF
jgi:hypothetical protein